MSGKRDRAPEPMRGSQGSGCDRPALEGKYKDRLVSRRHLELAEAGQLFVPEGAPERGTHGSGIDRIRVAADGDVDLLGRHLLAERGDQLAAEERALRFYQSVAEAAGEPDVAALVGELAEEEREHVRLMAEWLAKYPAPKDGWADDPDPPAMQE